ncbi:hypothetical protein SMB554_08585 [Sinorhizobium meliloti]|nr:hypothetical protein SMB554_08585 [Sinorhizobium meliloti]ATA98919.1 hypothetical protein BWO76_21915 [Sinorhizobium meliloti]ATB04933.1 hypothetical protein BWO90_23740 [Sinorhizobium meliloti]
MSKFLIIPIGCTYSSHSPPRASLPRRSDFRKSTKARKGRREVPATRMVEEWSGKGGSEAQLMHMDSERRK